MKIVRNSLIALGAALLVGACTWLWFEVMEQVWEPQRRLSVNLAGKPMLAATRLLERRGYQVDVYKLLGDANLDALPDGTLILADNNGQMSEAQARQLLAWVRRGNTLVAQPRWSGGDDNDDDERPAPGARRKFRLKRLDEEDPLGAHAGVTMAFAEDMRDSCDTGLPPPRKRRPSPATAGDGDGDGDGDGRQYDGETQFTCVTAPGGRYPLVLETSDEVLASLDTESGAKPDTTRKPLWSDPDAVALRVYAEGRGKLVMMSDNFFNNARLPRYDHAELLLTLAALQPAARRAMIVQDINATPWYLALWRSGSMALSALAVLLVLLLWRAMIGGRFGPLLPEPAGARRALLEHIEASGNWLWKVSGGRAVLLGAARRETLALLARRAPELRLLEGNALCARLARLHGIDETALQEALHAEASAQPAVFTRQIRTLQQVRISYEHSERQ
jgi:hypothetical protein